jgi:hypothetical protein
MVIDIVDPDFFGGEPPLVNHAADAVAVFDRFEGHINSLVRKADRVGIVGLTVHSNSDVLNFSILQFSFIACSHSMAA